MISQLLRRVGRSVEPRVKLSFRLATYPLRQQPSFMIIGGQKCGTTSLGEYLWQHPQIAPERYKEIHFFDARYHNGMAWYRTHFPLSFRAQWAGKTMCFDNTPNYLFSPVVPERVAQAYPDIKLIALLRNPVERTISHYFHMRRKGFEHLPLMEALDREAERTVGEVERMRTRKNYSAHDHRRYSYFGRSHYLPQIQRWHQYYPKERLLIVRSEDLFNDLETTYTHILDFLGLPHVLPQKTRIANRGTNRTDVEPEIRQHLVNLYRPYNEALYAYLGRDFGWEEAEKN